MFKYTSVRGERTLLKLGVAAAFLAFGTHQIQSSESNSQENTPHQHDNGIVCEPGTSQITARGVRARVGPGTEYTVETFLHEGQQVQVTGPRLAANNTNAGGVISNTWCEITLDGKILDVFSGYVSPLEPSNISQSAQNQVTQNSTTTVVETGQCPPGSNGQLATVTGNTGDPELPIGRQVSIITFGSDGQDLVQTAQCHSFNISSNLISGGEQAPVTQNSNPQEGWWGGVDNPNYVSPVLQGCKYSNLNITQITYTDYRQGRNYTIPNNPYDVIAWLGNQRGQDAWLGYADQVAPGQHAGFAMDADASIISEFRFIASTNIVNGETVQNDQVAIQFLQSQSTGRQYILPYQSMTTFARSNGENSGQHLCGIYQISPDTVTLLETSGLIQ